MPSISIPLELSTTGVHKEIILEVDFKIISRGRRATYYDPPEGPEIEIETIFWPSMRRKKVDNVWTSVPDHIEMPMDYLPDEILEAIDEEVIERYDFYEVEG
jgi:hypothetical protein